MSNSKLVTSIDVGYTNLGIIVAEVDQEWVLRKILYFRRVNLANQRHEVVPMEECKLHHSREVSDLTDHFVQQHRSWLQISEFVLIERQPPTGMKHVEQLLFKEFREKAVLMSPNSMHAYFGIQDLEYDERKVKVTEIADEMLKTNPMLHLKFQGLTRKHDVGDSAAHLKKFIEDKARELAEERRGMAIKWKLNLDQYIYQPVKKCKYFQ